MICDEPQIIVLICPIIFNFRYVSPTFQIVNAINSDLIISQSIFSFYRYSSFAILHVYSVFMYHIFVFCQNSSNSLSIVSRRNVFKRIDYACVFDICFEIFCQISNRCSICQDTCHVDENSGIPFREMCLAFRKKYVRVWWNVHFFVWDALTYQWHNITNEIRISGIAKWHSESQQGKQKKRREMFATLTLTYS